MLEEYTSSAVLWLFPRPSHQGQAVGGYGTERGTFCTGVTSVRVTYQTALLLCSVMRTQTAAARVRILGNNAEDLDSGLLLTCMSKECDKCACVCGLAEQLWIRDSSDITTWITRAGGGGGGGGGSLPAHTAAPVGSPVPCPAPPW